MKRLFIIISIFYVHNLHGQTQDTIFYDSNWEVTSNDSASYYRVIKEDSLFIVHDYYISGQVQMKGYYKDLDQEVKHGEFIYYTKDGEVSKISHYKDGVYISKVACYNGNGDLIKDIDFEDELDSKPEFEGGWDGFHDYIANNLVFPTIAQENGVWGSVFLTFCIMKDGSIDDIRITRSADRYLDKEAIRVVKSSPKWKPGQLNGETIVVKYDFKINFVLE